MNLNKRIFILFDFCGKIAHCDPLDDLNKILRICLQKFALEHENPNEYGLFTVIGKNHYLIEEATEIQNNDELLLKKFSEAIKVTSRMTIDDIRKESVLENEKSFADNEEVLGEIQSHKSILSAQLDDEYGEYKIEEPERDNSESFQLYKEEDLQENEEEFTESENENATLDNSENSIFSNDSEDFGEINIEEIKDQEYATREELSEELNKWSSQLSFKLSYETAERSLLKENCLVSRLQCSKRSCPFF